MSLLPTGLLTGCASRASRSSSPGTGTLLGMKISEICKQPQLMLGLGPHYQGIEPRLATLRY